MSLRQLPLDDPGWDRFVRHHPDATPFHNPAWASLLGECYGLSGFVLAEVDEGGVIVAGIPLLMPPRLPRHDRRLVSLPFTDAVQPLVDRENARRFVSAADAFRKELGAARIELRGTLDGAEQTAATAVIHELELARDPDVVARGFSHDRRRRIRIAERSGLRIRWAEDERELTDAFFNLHLATRRRLGVPTQPKRFFRLLWSRIIEQGAGFVLVVESGGAPVADAVFLTGNDTVVYKYGATDRRRLQDNPNDLLLSVAIRNACERGYGTLDFGRSELQGQGLRAFKSSWGAVEVPLVYSTIGPSKPVDVAGGHELMGGVLRRAPAFVTRAFGEVFYRYAA